MEINSGHSNVQISIAVQPQSSPRSQGAEESYSFDDNAPNAAVQTSPGPSLNTSGQEVGNLINTWA